MINRELTYGRYAYQNEIVDFDADDACKALPRRPSDHHRSGRSELVIQVQMIRQDTNHADKRRRHQGRAWCEVAGRRFEAQGPAPIYKLSTLLWLHGHGGTDFEVHDDVSPTGTLGGLAMTGWVRNWARLVMGKPKFDRKALHDPSFTPTERDAASKAAGKVTGMPQRAPLSGDNARTMPISVPSDPKCPQQEEATTARVSTAQRPMAA